MKSFEEQFLGNLRLVSKDLSAPKKFRAAVRNVLKDLNICLLQPKREQRRFEAIQTRLISLFQLRPRRPDVPALLKLRLGFL